MPVRRVPERERGTSGCMVSVVVIALCLAGIAFTEARFAEGAGLLALVWLLLV